MSSTLTGASCRNLRLRRWLRLSVAHLCGVPFGRALAEVLAWVVVALWAPLGAGAADSSIRLVSNDIVGLIEDVCP